MQDKINQAVVFTKPVHHLGLPLTPQQLDAKARKFLTEKGFEIVASHAVTGPELAQRHVIQQHYLMYSKAACVESADGLELSDRSISKFEFIFGKKWLSEEGKILGSPALQQKKGISAHELYLQWNEQFACRKTQKIQDGVIIAWLPELDCYCINAFYPAMEENFYHPATKMNYYVIEFDPTQVSWAQFRQTILGVTNASKAVPESFRGQLFATYGSGLEYPGRDNFVHGSAGPFEGLIERIIHEPHFKMDSNPVGRILEKRGVDLDLFTRWKANQSVSKLGALFDATEEKDTHQIATILEDITF